MFAEFYFSVEPINWHFNIKLVSNKSKRLKITRNEPEPVECNSDTRHRCSDDDIKLKRASSEQRFDAKRKLLQVSSGVFQWTW